MRRSGPREAPSGVQPVTIFLLAECGRPCRPRQNPNAQVRSSWDSTRSSNKPPRVEPGPQQQGHDPTIRCAEVDPVCLGHRALLASVPDVFAVHATARDSNFARTEPSERPGTTRTGAHELRTSCRNDVCVPLSSDNADLELDAACSSGQTTSARTTTGLLIRAHRRSRRKSRVAVRYGDHLNSINPIRRRQWETARNFALRHASRPAHPTRVASDHHFAARTPRIRSRARRASPPGPR
jgi:hypothetical protein